MLLDSVHEKIDVWTYPNELGSSSYRGDLSIVLQNGSYIVIIAFYSLLSLAQLTTGNEIIAL